MKKLILILLMSALLAGVLYAQEKKPSKVKGTTMLSLNAGINTGSLLDRNLSPLIYRKSGSFYSFDYQRYSGKSKNLFLGNVAYMGGSATSIASEIFTTSYIDGAVSFAWLRKTASKVKVDFYLGGGYSSFINYMEFNNTNEAFTFSLAHSLSLSAYADWFITDKQKMNFSLSSPIFGLLVRPPYSGYDDELSTNLDHPLKLITNGEVQTMNNLFIMNFKMKHQYQINERLSTNLAYNFTYQKLPKVNQFNHQLSAGLNYKF